MIKILHILNSFSGGGAERMVIDLCNNSSSKYEHQICILGGSQNAYENFLNPTTKVYYLSRLNQESKTGRRLSRLIIKENIKIVIAHMVQVHRFVFSSIFFIPKVKLLLVHHNNLKSYLEQYFSNKIKRYIVKKWLEIVHLRADAVVGVAAETTVALDLISDLSKCHTIYNPVNHDMILEKMMEDPPREMARFIDDSEYTLCTMGRLKPQKGYLDLLSGLLKIRKRLDCSLIIMGDGPMKEEILAQAKSLGISKKLYISGFIENPWAIIKSCDAYVSSSRWEGFYLSGIEAMICHTPCVLSDCDYGPREYIEDGVNGFLYKINNMDEFSEKLYKLLKSGSLQNKFIQSSLEASKKFSLKKAREDYEKLFDGIL